MDEVMKKATTKTQIKDLNKSDKLEHYNAVLLEDIKSKIEFVLEAVDVTQNTLKSESKHLEERVTQEIELLKTVIHKHSDEIGFNARVFDSLSNNIKENNLQIVELRKKLAERLDKTDECLDDHETRIVGLETTHP